MGGSGVSVNVFCDDTDKLQQAAADIADIISDTEGIVNPSNHLKQYIRGERTDQCHGVRQPGRSVSSVRGLAGSSPDSIPSRSWTQGSSAVVIITCLLEK